MNQALILLAQHGYWVVFARVFLDQAGLPLPSFPVLLAGGALAHTGSLNLFAVMGVAALGALLSDTFRFEVGRRRGGSVLQFICRTSLEPEILPGAIRMALSEIARRHSEMRRGRDIVLYCSCPNERTSTRAALLLQQYGIRRVRPLEGGYVGWRKRNFPLVPKDEIRNLSEIQSTSALDSEPPSTRKGAPQP